MRNTLVCLITFCSLALLSCGKQVKKSKEPIDTMFAHHFRILDSAMTAVKPDTICTCCAASVDFMEQNTEIEGSYDGTLVGRLKLYITRSDLQKWHDWYSKNRE